MPESFERGQRVRINDGVFRNFIGAVAEINEERKMLTVSLTVFSRPVSIELRFTDVQRAA